MHEGPVPNLAPILPTRSPHPPKDDRLRSASAAPKKPPSALWTAPKPHTLHLHGLRTPAHVPRPVTLPISQPPVDLLPCPRPHAPPHRALRVEESHEGLIPRLAAQAAGGVAVPSQPPARALQQRVVWAAGVQRM